MSPHPYSPSSALVPGWTPNETPTLRLAAAFAALCSAAVGSALWIAWQPPFRHWLRSADLFAIGWFALCGFLHCCFEGYFVYYQGEMAGMQTLFAQLMKYYALADSRYMTLDNFTVCIETITVLVWGPLSLLTVYAILARSPSRHLLQAIVSVAHIYSVTLYFFTEYRNEQVTGHSSSLPDFLYYWVYYVGFNAAWAVVPAYLLCDSWAAITTATKEKDARDVRKKDQ